MFGWHYMVKCLLSANWQDETEKAAHRRPILHKHTPKWQKKSMGSHCRRSSQTAETHRVLPAVDESKREWEGYRQTERGERAFRWARCNLFNGTYAGKSALTSVTIKRPLTKDTLQMTSRRSLRRWPVKKKDGYMSDMHVTRPSRHTNCGSKKKCVSYGEHGLKLPTDTDSNELCSGN